jgi:hypothetical protein
MKNFLAFIGAAVVTILALGWYLEWYKVGRVSSGSGQTRVEIDINKDKIKTDVGKGLKQGSEKFGEFLDNRDANKTEKNPTTAIAPKDKRTNDDILRDWFPDFAKQKQ